MSSAGCLGSGDRDVPCHGGRENDFLSGLAVLERAVHDQMNPSGATMSAPASYYIEIETQVVLSGSMAFCFNMSSLFGYCSHIIFGRRT
jgi:hypothetical protein